MKRARRSVALLTLGFALKAVLSLLVYAMPLLGFWVASSLAAYRGGATWLPLVVGLLAFPIAPLAWDAVGELRRKKRGDTGERILTFGDRILLRTFAITFTLIALLLAARPELAFVALSTRGDWMLDGRHSALAENTRRVLFRAAQGLEWLYELAHENPFAKLVDEQKPEPPELPAPGTNSAPQPAPAPSPPTRPADRVPSPQPAPLPPIAWPAPATLHPAVANMPRDVEQSFNSVASYLREREPNPRQRIKALHDWVSDRIAYDAEALADNAIPDQSAHAVFSRRKGVCAGYANLLDAMAKVTGDEVVVVVGDARTNADDVNGVGHAWNAARLDGRWFLIDATWDAGSVSGRTFEKDYGTDYLFTPPDVFIINHLPDHENWQLRDKPLSRGEFMRQPMLKAGFFARGFRLVQPDRSQVTVGDALEIVLDNPSSQHILASFWPKASDGEERTRCRVSPGPRITAHCAFPDGGVFRVMLFANAEPTGRFEDVASFEAVRR